MAKLKDKERFIKVAGERHLVTYKGTPLSEISLSSDFSTETFQARRYWHEILKVTKSKAYNKGYFTQQQGYHLKPKKKYRAFQTRKSKAVSYQQTSITRNVKGPA